MKTVVQSNTNHPPNRKIVLLSTVHLCSLLCFGPEQLCNYLPFYQGQSAAWQPLYKQTSLPLTLHKVCDKTPC